ncbi:hypothetical protein LSTR_LSTR004414 [Laodelphax striatellus]|uniref:Uncharacterized protein n=1 Tax=Laodelphax striatellus TaxID=195883 RepID=A0A482X949_LAOST|nr:hypothetical protein LSTR_LSTR004414 [Laodelphax striatellus]
MMRYQKKKHQKKELVLHLIVEMCVAITGQYELRRGYLDGLTTRYVTMCRSADNNLSDIFYIVFDLRINQMRPY